MKGNLLGKTERRRPRGRYPDEVMMIMRANGNKELERIVQGRSQQDLVSRLWPDGYQFLFTGDGDTISGNKNVNKWCERRYIGKGNEQ